ncbi:MAG: hypothetical protein ACFFBP_06700 [Promethearchaeota archaeon]
MISGVKRKTTAVESALRYFQTVDLIISHFKREADREKIFELLNNRSTLKDFLIATAAIHCYHNLGIRVHHTLEKDIDTAESTKNLELHEKKILFDEISLLLENSIELEIDLLYRILERENKFLSFLIEERDFKRHKERDINDLEEQIENELLEIIRKQYPPFFFYDMVSDIIGLTNHVKEEILNESSKLKDLSLELEKKLRSEEKEDKFIEISTLNRAVERMKEDFEFKSYKELQVNEMPLRKIKKRIFGHYFNFFPISIPALKVFLEANEFKKEIINKFEVSLNSQVNFDEFEKDILNFIKEILFRKLKTHPNDFIYFLQSLNENSFNEIIYILNKYGVNDVIQIMDISEEKLDNLKKIMSMYNIKKFDIMAFNDPTKDLIFLSRKAKIEQKPSNISEEDLKTFIKKKEIVEKVILNDLNLRSHAHILLLINFNDILERLLREFFYYLFSKIFRPLARIIELYYKVSNNKALFLLALKKMNETTESEKWVFIKIEELLIQRIIKMQEDLVIILNSTNKPFLINGFILARLLDSGLKENVSKLKNEPSPLYEEILPLSLDPGIISPISYCIAYDLIKRFETYEFSRKQERKKTIESKEKEKEEKVSDLRKKQKDSTLNWIERRITSTLIGINKPNFNPTGLYWQEKDLKTAIDNIKLHSELEGDITERFSEFFQFAMAKIKSFAPDMKLPDDKNIKNTVNNIIKNTLEFRLERSPTPEDIKIMIEGERFKIAEEIAKNIGKIFDKTLYMKFKSSRKK